MASTSFTNMTATVVWALSFLALQAWVIYSVRTWSRVQRPEETVIQETMFADMSDFASYKAHCGRHWREVFLKWEKQQSRAMLGDRSVKLTVWRCRGSCGGLGDRQRGILTSFMLAMVTNRAFFIDHEDPMPLRHYFHVANPSLHWTFDESMLQNRTVLEEDFMNAFPGIGDYAAANLSYYDQYDVVIQANNFWQPFHVLHNPILAGQFRVLRSYEEHILAGCILNYLLVPARELQMKLRSIRSKILKENKQIIAVQVRTGDSQVKNSTVIETVLQRFQACVQSVENSFKISSELFLTTDSTILEERFRTLRPDLYTFAGDIFHIDGPFGSPQNPDAAFRKTILDHLMISQADHLVISRSGFAEYAAVRGFKSYYTPVNCKAGKPIPHFSLPDHEPAGVSGQEIHSVEAIFQGLTKME